MANIYATWASDIETAITAVIAAIGTEDTVEYEIRGRRHKVVPTVDLLDKLEMIHSRVSRRAALCSKGMRLASLSRTSRRGSS